MMDEAERRAFAALRFNWAPTPDDVWRPAPFHVEGLHRDVLRSVLDGVAEADQDGGSSPIGVAVLGTRGTGKTHLLGSLREHVQRDGGYFFLVSLLEASAFWRSTALSLLDGFARPAPDGQTQLTVFLRRLADAVGAPRLVRRAVLGEYDLNRSTLDAFVDLIRKADRQVGIECQDTVRALVLQAAEQPRLQDVGYEFLCSNDEVEAGERIAWGLRRGKRSAQEIVRDVSRLLALTGPTVIAVDQIDLLIAQSVKSSEGDDRAEWQTSLLLEQIAGGLMDLRENTRRSLSVVACLPQTWEQIRTQATDTVQDRFREALWLRNIPTPELGRELVARRFAERFGGIGFEPPYPTWPVRDAAFERAVEFTPRELLKTIDAHLRGCLAAGHVRELDSLLPAVAGGLPGGAAPDSATGLRPGLTAEPAEDIPADLAAELPLDVPDDDLAAGFAAIDERYAQLLRRADPAPALLPAAEDTVVPALLTAGLTAWIAERGPAGDGFSLDPQAGGKPALHARLRLAGDEDTDDEEHWAFRAICAPHHIAALNRIRNAVTTAGLSEGVSRRRLFLLRNQPWSTGARTREAVAAFTAAGGRTLAFPEPDVARLVALERLLDEYGTEPLLPWLRARRPTDAVTFLREALGPTAPPSPAQPPAAPPSPARQAPAQSSSPQRSPARGGHEVPVGSGIDGDGSVTVGLESLRRHAAIFAGSGSGKTVLIRRLVEECALRGVSAIVLDPNNDLARLGEPWPAPPPGWGPADADRAAEYLRTTDVVVWTPRRESGRPLSFRPLPEFADILDDPDALVAGIDAAVAALAPHARVDGTTDRARLGRAVLRETLTSYARQGSSDLRGLIGLLDDLPDGVSRLDDAPRLAAIMAQLLTAATVNDPLLGGGGTPVDPGVLLRPPPGARARVSVISFVGLPDDVQRQSFVNQLQLALFAWVKRHPAGDRPLGGLFVMDEAQTLAPSGAMTACTQSTLALASQARKYGLGLVFATQAPKGLHNRIPGNAATQFFGLLNSPAQIAAAQELARAKGSPVTEIARLRAGQFYASVEGAAFVRLQAPMCLTHHPRSPLTVEEVVERAAAGAHADR